jgi:hypothetical protein
MARKPARVISHWYHYVEGFATSAMDFYASVEESVKGRELPGASLSRVEFKEGGVLSAKREYLRVQREKTVFDLCAAPYGKQGYFFSWWLAELPGNPLVWLFATLGIGFAYLVLFGILWAMLGDSCGGIVLFILFVLAGIPGGLYALGYGVREGAIGDEEVVLAMPFVGWLYERVFQPTTYYRIDTALMFQEAVRASVNEVLEGLFSDQGLK